MKENEKTETAIVVLPDEVKELAQRVPEQKQKEVQTVLTQIFAGTADWKKQAESIVVKDIHDNMSIQMAEAGRKNVKTARLAAEKIFDAKRDEVQQKKAEFDLEDKLWLKAKQTAQILFKDIESTFEWKAKFVERYEAEQKELVTQLRIEKVSKYTDDINRIALENMSDQMFDMFLSGIEKAHNERIADEKKAEEERIENEKKQKVYDSRTSFIAGKKNSWYTQSKTDLVVKFTKETTDDEWNNILKDIETKESEFAKEAEENKKEADRLKKEKDDKEAEEKKKAASEKLKVNKYIVELVKIGYTKQSDRIYSLGGYTVSTDILKSLNDTEFKTRVKEVNDNIIRDKQLKEIAAKKAADEAAKKAEEKARKDAEKKARLAPDKDKLLNFMQAINDIPRPDVKSLDAADIASKANIMLVQSANFIKENASKL